MAQSNVITRNDAGKAMCKAMGLLWTRHRRWFLLTWYAGENTAARFNPTATTMREPGSTNFNTAGVQSYASYSSGITAWHQTFNLGYYDELRRRFRLNTTALAMCNALAASPWGTFHDNPKLAKEVLLEVKGNLDHYAGIPIGQ